MPLEAGTPRFASAGRTKYVRPYKTKDSPDGNSQSSGIHFPRNSVIDGGSPMSLRLASLMLVALVTASTAVTTLNVQIKEYDVPTPKSRPHDPALAPDGSLWYTGQ